MEEILKSCVTLEEAAEKFSLAELLDFVRERTLQDWLRQNFYEDEAQLIENAVTKEIGEVAIKLLICKIFRIDIKTLSAEDFAEISEFIAKKQFATTIIDGTNHGDKKVAVVQNQRELINALRGGAEVVYLCGGEFKIPFQRPNMIYIGRQNAIVDINAEENLNLDELNIILEDLQVCMHNQIELRAEKSKNLKILNGTKTTLGLRPTLKEIFEILQGRYTFESPREFKLRAENISGVAVGYVLLKAENYNYDAEKFILNPKWNLDYISVLKDFLDANFELKLSPELARKLYENERELQIFADFTAKDGVLKILVFYLETNELGRLELISYRNEFNCASSSSSFNGAGYGLDIISYFDEDDDD